MKRIVSGLFTIALTFVFACNSHSIKHPGIVPADPTLKTIAIIVADGSDTDPVISVVPDPIKIKINDKIKWVVYNNRGDGSLNVKIDTFIIDGSTTPESPFRSGKTAFDLTSVASGSTASYPAGDETTAAKRNTYKYTIHATVTSPGGAVTKLRDLDPRIVVSE
ncbi:MAG: hypothetical protein WBV94_05260 [Blastocatellia bacterium]